MMQDGLRDRYQVINLGLNGTINSAAQMQIITNYLEPGDIFFHTPEFASGTQMLIQTDMAGDDLKLWCGMEYNYDLVCML